MDAEIRKCINAVGLDPAIGFLHETTESKTSLVFDLQEVFRWIIDLSILQLLEERKLLKKSYFIITKNYHTRLKEQTAKMLIEKISENFNRRAPYKGKHYSYQSILMNNVLELANYTIGKRKGNFHFDVIPIEIQRNDSLQLQKRIMTMTSKERKRFGINKSTLWYHKKHLTKAKTIKIYNKVFSKLK